MANAKEIKRRIKSIDNIGKITKAMELISTVKMKKAQRSALEKKEFIKEILKVFLKIETSLKDFPLFNENGKATKTLAIWITSNKWLCWSYNINVMKKVNSYVKETWEELDYIALWKRFASFVWKTWNNLVADFSQDFTDNIEPIFTKQISRLITDKFLSWEYKKVVVFYNHYVNTITQVPVSRKFLEVSKDDIFAYFKQILWDDFDKELESARSESANYTFEPGEEEVANDLVPMILDMMFLDIVSTSKASEHSARMVAMNNAKDAAKKYSSELTLKYNKARQAAITAEVSEIVAWAESMKD